MKKILFLLLLAYPFSSYGQVTLDSSNLPIIGIYTSFQSIPDEPKIIVDMAIIDNGYNVTNHVTDTNYTYYGKIGIEKRGSITQLWPQPSYNIETRDSLGNAVDFSPMGMPKESDWVLYGPWDDHSLMHNVLTYELVRQMGYWAPRTKYCELLLNTFISWNYKGVYVLMEKIKRDKNRLDISKLDVNDNAGDSLTGGYLIAVDKNINKPDSGWFSSHPQNANVFFTYKYPKGEDITSQQKTYIQSYVDSFETAIASSNFANPITGYRKYIEPVSFMDFFFIQELSKNGDAYKRSSYLYKDKYSKGEGGKLHAGPHWDYNSAWGLKLCGFDSDTGWAYPMTCWINSAYPVPFWWSRMLQDTSYTHELKCRWMFLRSTVLDTANIFHIIDSVASYLSVAQARQYDQYNFTDNFQNQVDSLKWWIKARLAWMDTHMPGNCWNAGVHEATFENSFNIYPNPSSEEVNINFHLGMEKNLKIELYDSFGKKVKQIGEKKYAAGDHHIKLDFRDNMTTGIYFLQISSSTYTYGKKVVRTE